MGGSPNSAREFSIPGGSLICYTGQSRLDRDIAIFSKHLRFWWLMAMMHTQTQRLPGKFVMVGFKPVLWYVKEFRRGKTLVPDVLEPPKREKHDHEWGQGEGSVTPLIEHLAEPGELIVIRSRAPQHGGASLHRWVGDGSESMWSRVVAGRRLRHELLFSYSRSMWPIRPLSSSRLPSADRPKRGRRLST
jgi:hypothetical protein